ncbi:ataxin-10 [Tieghemostelium lacteum]|uniref:Ataxin-10 n=1 Tax=Tieghemostelium lacteum TaxID=361077 RepID=A0A151Z838_TIELA|nr:ataxin-10 [Tieghemostelium lacteum]|eukprot:KYQ90098.1 ataxin-10 [Tieghemostelium lacteum]
MSLTELTNKLNVHVENEQELKPILNEIIELLKDQKYRNSVTCEFINYIVNQIDIRKNSTPAIVVYYIRILRNCCANSPINQSHAHNEKLMLFIYNLFQHNHELLFSVSTVQTTVQLFINMIVQNDDVQRLVWSEFYPDVLIKSIKNNIENKDKCKIIPMLLMALYNFIISSKERRDDVVSNALLVDLVMSLLSENDVGEGGEDEQYQDQLFHWIHLIVKLLIDNDYFSIMYSKLGSQEQNILLTKGKSTVNQLKLVKLLEALVTDKKNIRDYIESNSLIDMQACLFLLSELSQLYNLDFSRESATATNTTTALNNNDFNILFHIIKLFANVTSYSDEMLSLMTAKSLKNDDNQLNTILCKKGLLAICIGSLHGNYSSADLVDGQQQKQQHKESDEGSGFKKELIRIIGNLAYKNKNNQDEIRELGGIEIILNHCRFDPSNPYIREWSIFAIRNLCDENLQNQQLIQNLKMQGVAKNEELQDLGIQIETTENGTLKFTQTPKNPTTTITTIIIKIII